MMNGKTSKKIISPCKIPIYDEQYFNHLLVTLTKSKTFTELQQKCKIYHDTLPTLENNTCLLNAEEINGGIIDDDVLFLMPNDIPTSIKLLPISV